MDLGAVSLGAIEIPSLATWNWLGVTRHLSRPVTEEVLGIIAQQDAGAPTR